MDIETFIFNDALGSRCDYQLAGGALAADHDIKTAVLISLFSDRRAEADDPLPDAAGSRRGWWGDALTGRRLGSRLWLLSREKQLREVVNRAREYAEEALAWLVEEGVARRVRVSAEILQPGWIALTVLVERNGTAPARYRYEFAWAGAPAVRN
ncbi:MAG: phage GP46 family protein [Pseudomonadota bacterium]